MNIEKLLGFGKSVAVAESVTGGGIGFNLTSIPGASTFFWGGFITYSNSAKISLLGVKSSSLDKYGPVSSEVAIEMAIGARMKSGCDIGLSITGDAGPDPLRRVGKVFIGISTAADASCLELNLKGRREEIRDKAIDGALNFLLEKCSLS